MMDGVLSEQGIVDVFLEWLAEHNDDTSGTLEMPTFLNLLTTPI